MKTHLRFFRPLFIILMLTMTFQVSGQIAMLPPVSDGYTKICAGIDSGSGPFNSYNVTIAWGGTANSDNEFILELSDVNGDFTNALELGRAGDQNTANPKSFDLNFGIPTDTQGEGYKFRARSTSPESQAVSADTYPIYYMDVTSNLNISENGDGIPPGSLCDDTSITLQVDNITNPENYNYKWYRSLSPLAETGHTITATESGMYQVFIDYGECSFNANTDSNIVTITIGGTGASVGIITPTKTALCSGDTEILTIDTTGLNWSYQWYKDNTVISGATSTSYTVDASNSGFEGDYQVEISAIGLCTEKSSPLTITNGDVFTVTRNNPADIVILPLQTETLSITTSANSPTYQWFRNGSPMPGATNIDLDITQDGTYYCAVTSTGSCSSTQNSENTDAVVPNNFEIIIGNDSSYIACGVTNTIVQILTINAVATDGSTSDVTAQLEDSFVYQWQKNNTDIVSATSKSISLTDTSENGDYLVKASLGSYNETSNQIPIQLSSSETLTIIATSTIFCSDTDDTLFLSTSKDLIGESYSWEKDGTSVNTTDTQLYPNEAGTYQLVISKNGCNLRSNEITIAPLDPNLISLDVDGDVIFPEGSSKTVTASGGTAYQWIDENNNVLSSTDQLTFNEAGSVTLIADIDNCQITRQITAIYLELFNVPNVITPNGDGSNDQWVIPNSYSNKSDITITIYNDQGLEILNENSYTNNWPQSSVVFPKQNMIFYYVIKNANETLKQGTITVIR